MAFDGFPDEAFVFYEGLEADNSKTYWTQRKDVFEACVREPMVELGEALESEFGPARLFRPYRDVRFSKDKSPYKTAQGAFAESVPGMGYYVQISADGLYAAGGFYASASDQVERYREAVDEEEPGKALAKIVEALEAAGYGVHGDMLKTRPRGFAEDHPRLELLRHKSLYAGVQWQPDDWVHAPEALERVRKAWRDLTPLVDWCSQYVGQSEKPRR